MDPEYMKLSLPQRDESRRAGWLDDVGAWRADMENHRISTEYDASSAVLPQSSPAQEPKDRVPEDFFDICWLAFDEHAATECEKNKLGYPVLRPRCLASIISNLCVYAGYRFGTESDEELSKHIVRDLNFCLSVGGSGIEVEAGYWGDNEPRVTFRAFMLMLSGHPWARLLPAKLPMRMPLLLMEQLKAHVQAKS